MTPASPPPSPPMAGRSWLDMARYGRLGNRWKPPAGLGQIQPRRLAGWLARREPLSRCDDSTSNAVFADCPATQVSVSSSVRSFVNEVVSHSAHAHTHTHTHTAGCKGEGPDKSTFEHCIRVFRKTALRRGTFDHMSRQVLGTARPFRRWHLNEATYASSAGWQAQSFICHALSTAVRGRSRTAPRSETQIPWQWSQGRGVGSGTRAVVPANNDMGQK